MRAGHRSGVPGCGADRRRSRQAGRDDRSPLRSRRKNQRILSRPNSTQRTRLLRRSLSLKRNSHPAFKERIRRGHKASSDGQIFGHGDRYAPASAAIVNGRLARGDLPDMAYWRRLWRSQYNIIFYNQNFKWFLFSKRQSRLKPRQGRHERFPADLSKLFRKSSCFMQAVFCVIVSWSMQIRGPANEPAPGHDERV